MSGSYDSPQTASLLDDNQPITTDSDKANIFAQHFANVSHDKNYTQKFRRRKKKLDAKWENIEPQHNNDTQASNDPVTLSELQRALNQST